MMILRTICAMCLLAGMNGLALANTGDVEPKLGAISPSEIQSADTLIQRYVELGWFSGNVLIADKNTVLFDRSYGLANVAKQQENQSCTRFNIGSIAKHYTAVLILQLIEQGKLQLDSSLSDFNFELDKSLTEGVTIAHLLHHQAGFADIFIPAYIDDPLSFDSLEKKIALLKNRPRLFEPGTDSRYSNYGYILLGAILEKVTGQTFAELLQERIFTPIGANNSSLVRWEGSECQSERYVFSIKQQLIPTDFREVSGPDGGIEASADDVYRFYQALFFTDKLLDRQGPAFSHYFAKPDNHLRAYGGGTGVSAAVEVLADKNLVLVVLANSDELVAERISSRLGAMLNHQQVDEVLLPAKHFIYQQYQALGLAELKKQLVEQYQQAGYTDFMGRAINESGLGLIRQHQAKEGKDIIQLLGHFYPTAPQAYDSLAYAHYLLGDLPAAKEAFKRALELNEGFTSDYHVNNYQESL